MFCGKVQQSRAALPVKEHSAWEFACCSLAVKRGRVGEGPGGTRVLKSSTVEMWGLGRFCPAGLPSPAQGMLAVAAGRQALSSPSAF